MNTSEANPYESSDPTSSPTEAKVSRPVGTVALAVMLLLSGLFIGGERYYGLLAALTSGENVTIHPAYFVVLVKDTLTSFTAVVGAVGLLMGRRFGWWLSLIHLLWRVAIQGIWPLLNAVYAGSSNVVPQSNPIQQALTAGAMFLLLALYLQKQSVIRYFCIATRRTVAFAVILIACVGKPSIRHYRFE